MVDERTAYWGARDDARYRTRDDDPTGGDYVVAETLDANGDPVDVLLRWDDTAGEWVSGGPVNMNGSDVTNVGALDADSVSTVRVESKTTPLVNIKRFGAVGDGSTDDTAAIDSAVSHIKTEPDATRLYVPAGTYLYSGQLKGFLGDGGAHVLEGDSESDSLIQFTDSTVNSYVKPFDGLGVNDVNIKNINFVGAGKTAGTNVHCLDLTGSNFSPFDVTIENVSVGKCSGDGIYTDLERLFSSDFQNIDLDKIGRDGFRGVVSNTVEFNGFGRYATDIDGWLMWIRGGNPTVKRVNATNVGTNGDTDSGGLKFGRNSNDPDGLATSYPKIEQVNLEPVSGEYGLFFAEQSGPRTCERATIYAGDNDVTAGIAIGFLGNDPEFRNIEFIEDETGVFTDKYVHNTVDSTDCSLWDDIPDGIDFTTNKSTTYLRQIGQGNLPVSRPPVGTKFDFRTEEQGRGLLVEDASVNGDIYRIRVNNGSVEAEGPL